MSKELEHALNELERLKGLRCLSEKDYDYIVKALKEHEHLEEILENILDRDSDLCVEDCTHYDGHHSYHLVLDEKEDFLDIKISKEDYDLLVRYQYNGK